MILSVLGSPHVPFQPVLCRMGILACYLEPQELGSYLQDAAVSAALLPQLARCTSEGFISEGGRVSGTFSNTSVKLSHLSAVAQPCVSLTAALLVGSNCGELQLHGAAAFVCPQRTLAPVRGTFLALAPIAAAPRPSVWTRNTQIFTSTGQRGVCLSRVSNREKKNFTLL